MSDISLVYITASGIEEAEHLAQEILSGRLGACVNIYGAVRSLYLWKGSRESSEEVTMIVKTRSSLVPELARKVRECHSYETPCILAFPVGFADKEYADWILRETSSKNENGNK
ncbi:MAG: divalent-cation tolerance protein CutA [Candidatus Omnitrophota bacterium]